MEQKLMQKLSNSANVIRNTGLSQDLNFNNIYKFSCFDKFGNLKWEEECNNRVVTEGLNHVLDVVFYDATKITTWYCGLTGPITNTFPGDNLAAGSAGWSEITDSSGSPDREEVVWNALSGSSMSNSSNVAQFVFSGSATVGGAVLVSAASGNTGILYGVADFTGPDRVVADGDVVNVTITITAGTT